jgi:GH15 family glucan-1,4-alpha-glucosidase
MVQTRAGAAFRAAGAGLAVPAEAPFDPAILEGIADAVAVHTGHGSRFTRRVVELLDLGRDTDRLVETAFQPLRALQAPSGAIAAAPPPDEPDAPNYWFFWQRDAAQVVIALADLAAESGTLQGAARTMLDAYIGFVRRLPRQPGIGPADLGISRFSMEGEPIRSYGNPQNDGPAQAVLAVVAALGVGDPAYEVCRPYLDYLASCALGPGFDPWEFAVGDIFFDFNLARRALRLGARLAKACDDASGARRYTGRADEIERELEMFFDPAEGYIRAGRRFLQPLLRGISHLDISVVGSVLTAYDVRDPVLNVDHPLVSGTMKALERVSAERWPVNVAWQRAGRAGMGIARFPEDTNDGIGATGGNPWTFVTLWAAQFYLRSIQRLEFLGASDRGGARRAELLERADGYLQFVLAHLSPSALTEQIDGHTGEPRGARQLAWAQAALIQTLLLRRRIASAHAGQRT